MDSGNYTFRKICNKKSKKFSSLEGYITSWSKKQLQGKNLQTNTTIY